MGRATASKYRDFSLEFIKTPQHKNPLLLLQKHTFAQTTKDRRYWNCSKKHTLKCPAKLRFDENDILVHYRLDHNHAPPKMIKTSAGHYYFVRSRQRPNSTDWPYEIHRTSKGKTIMIFQNYTFSNSWNDRCWYCSKRRSLGCPARVFLDKQNYITRYNNEHNH
ncbi:FLYWCH zinc finger domain-containing protein [Phthorimaea operculella]|nr:FLYWCH zinc finger domain-containing protein [Phthorimaea operculella]